MGRAGSRRRRLCEVPVATAPLLLEPHIARVVAKRRLNESPLDYEKNHLSTADDGPAATCPIADCRRQADASTVRPQTAPQPREPRAFSWRLRARVASRPECSRTMGYQTFQR